MSIIGIPIVLRTEAKVVIAYSMCMYVCMCTPLGGFGNMPLWWYG